MNEDNRKLAAIVFTDIVGFTKLTASDQKTASELLDLQREHFKPLVESYHGKWVKEVGDGLILTFDTINKAVHCCVKIQEIAKNIEFLSLRIGIHLGEILEKDNDIIGDDEEYKYLRNMTIDSVEEENYEKLLKLKAERESELEKIKITTIEDMWLEELSVLEKEYTRYKNDRVVRAKGIGAKIKKKIKKKSKKKN